MDLLLDMAPCGVLRFDRDEVIVATNKTVCEWLGYAVGSLDGAALSEVLSPASAVFYESSLAPLLALRGAVDDVFLTLRSASGDDLPVRVSAVRRETDEGPVTDAACLRVGPRHADTPEASGARG